MPVAGGGQSRALPQVQCSWQAAPVATGPGGCVAATVEAAALLVLPAGEELAAAPGAWELVCPGAVAVCKL